MKLILTLLSASLFFLTYGQNKINIYQPFLGLPLYTSNATEVDSIKQLPTKIQFISDYIIKSSMSDFFNNVRFVKGQIIDLDTWLKNDSISQTEYKHVIPKYQLFFELKDTILGINKYCFELSFDQYGQVICFDWPREGYDKKTNFIDPNSVQVEAIKYAKRKKYKTDTFVFELKYDDETNKLCWHISFLQKSLGDEYNYSKKYKTIVIDSISLTVLKELEMHSVGTSN